MADPQSYPSPTSADTRAGAPFYHTGNSAGGSVVPTNNVPSLSLAEDRDVEVSQLEQLHNEIVAAQNIHPDLTNQATLASLAAVSSAADAAAALAASDAQQQLARQAISLGVAVDGDTAQTPPYQLGDEGSTTPGGGAVSTTASGKLRTKVSRACDECRRKKIRCDADGKDPTSCGSCKKSHQICQFSRTPQKRGPSKGYIRDLHDRLTSLEGRLHTGAGGSSNQALGNPEASFMMPAANSGVKRTRTMDDDHYTTANRGDTEPRSSPLELDESVVAKYHKFIHPVLPFLPATFDELRDSLNGVGSSTRRAFIAALECAVKAAHFTGDEEITQVTAKRAYELYHESLYDDSNSLVHVQTLMLLAIEADNHGMLKYHGGNGPASKEFISAAIRNSDLFGVNDIGSTDESNLRLKRGICVSLSMLDVMELVSSKRQWSVLSPHGVQVPKANKELVGGHVYWMSVLGMRLVKIVNVLVIQGNADDAEKLQESLNVQRIIGSEEIRMLKFLHEHRMENLQEWICLMDAGPNPMLPLMLFYVRIQLELRLWPLAEANNLLRPAEFMAQRLAQLEAPNPLTYHFAAQAAHVLLQLAEFSDTRAEAEGLLDLLEEGINAYLPAADTTSFDALVRDVLQRRRTGGATAASAAAAATAAAAAAGLEHLANAAVADNDDDTAMAEGEPVTAAAEDGGVAVAAAAEAAAAAAKAAQAQMGSVREFKGELMDREGYITALMAYV